MGCKGYGGNGVVYGRVELGIVGKGSPAEGVGGRGANLSRRGVGPHAGGPALRGTSRGSVEPVYLGVYGAWEYVPDGLGRLGMGSARGRISPIKGSIYGMLLEGPLDSGCKVTGLGGLADIWLSEGVGDGQRALTEEVDGNAGAGGSQESVLSGDACPISLVLGIHHGIGRGRPGIEQGYAELGADREQPTGFVDLWVFP